MSTDRRRHDGKGCTIRGIEHDACGVGFVVNVKGERSHDIIEQGLAGAAQPHAPRRLRLRSAHRRRRRHPACRCPTSSSRKASAARIALPARGRVRRRAWCSCRARSTSGTSASASSRRSSARRARSCSAGAACRSTPSAPRSAGARSDARDAPGLRRRAAATTPDQDALERKLYVIRKRVEQLVRDVRHAASRERFYVPSLSSRTIVYKGLLLPEQIPAFYHDLADPLFVSALALVHQRFSHQHLPVVGPRPSLPLHRPQRRDQHAARQRELDARAPGDVRLAAASTTSTKLFPIIDPRDQRLGQVRQRARAAGADRALAAPRGHDDDPRGVAEPREHERRRSARSTSTTPACRSRGTARRRSPSPTAASSARCSTATGCARRATSSPRTASS